jgi:hypothetical protein
VRDPDPSACVHEPLVLLLPEVPTPAPATGELSVGAVLFLRCA